MRKPYLHFVFLYIWFATLLLGEESKELELRALAAGANPSFRKALPESFETSSTREVSLFLVLKNISNHPIRVSTGNWTHRANGSVEKARFVFRLEKMESEEGETIMNSIADVRPVDLLPGEVAHLSADVTVDVRVKPEAIEVVYLVDEFMAHRFQLWGGKLSCKVTDATIIRNESKGKN